MAYDDDDDDGAIKKADKPRSDVFVGMLAIATVALIAAAVLMFLDHDALQKGTPKPSASSVHLADAGLNKVALPAGATK
jgi:hypothetical protein